MCFKIKLLKEAAEINCAIAIADKVFMEYESSSYGEEGIKSFRNFLYGNNMKARLKEENIILWGAYAGNIMVGMCGIRDKSHITLLFVKGEYHRRGIGRMLVGETCRYACEKYGITFITVNASPYGVPFYNKVGFAPTDMERMDDGIIYTPMKLTLKD